MINSSNLKSLRQLVSSTAPLGNENKLITFEELAVPSSWDILVFKKQYYLEPEK